MHVFFQKRSKRNIFKGSLLAACILSTSAVTAPVISTDYIGNGTGWFTNGNWDNGVPAISSNTTIDHGGTVIISNDSGITNNLVIGKMTDDNVLEVDSGSLTVNGSMDILNDSFVLKNQTKTAEKGIFFDSIGGRYEPTDSATSIVGDLNIGLRSIQFYTGDTDARFSMDGGSLSVGEDTFVGGGSTLAAEDSIVNSNHELELVDSSSVIMNRNMSLGSWSLGTLVLVEDDTSFALEDVIDFDLSGNLTAGQITGNFDESQKFDLTIESFSSNIDIGGDFDAGRISNTGSGVVDHDLNIEFSDSNINVDGFMNLSTLDNALGTGPAYMNHDHEFVNSSLDLGGLTSGIRSVGSNGILDHDLLFEDAFIELNSLVSFSNPATPILQFGKYSDLCFDVNGLTRATKLNVSDSDLYPVIEINLTNEDDLKGGITPPNIVELGGILRFDYNGSTVGLNAGDSFDIIRINNSDSFPFTGSFDGFDISGMPTSLTLQPFEGVSENKGVENRNYSLVIIPTQDVVSNDSNTDWLNSSTWTPNSVPNLGSDAVISGGDDILLTNDFGFVDVLTLGVGNDSSGLALSNSKLSVNNDFRIGSPSSTQFVAGDLNSFFGTQNSSTIFVVEDMIIGQPAATEAGDDGTYFIQTNYDSLDDEQLIIDGSLLIGFPESNSSSEAKMLSSSTVEISEMNSFRIRDTLEIAHNNLEGFGNIFLDTDIEFDEVKSIELEDDLLIMSSDVSGSGNLNIDSDVEFRDSNLLGLESMDFGKFQMESEGSVFAIGSVIVSDNPNDGPNRFYISDDFDIGILSDGGGSNETLVMPYFEIDAQTVSVGNLESGLIIDESEGMKTPGFLRSDIVLYEGALLEVQETALGGNGEFVLGDYSVIDLDISSTTRTEGINNNKGISSETYSAINIKDLDQNVDQIELNGRLTVRSNSFDNSFSAGQKFEIIRTFGSKVLTNDFDHIDYSGFAFEEGSLLGLIGGVETSTFNGQDAYVISVVDADIYNLTSTGPADFSTPSSWDQNSLPTSADRIRINDGNAVELSNQSSAVRDIQIASADGSGSGSLLLNNSTLSVGINLDISNPSNENEPAVSKNLNGSFISNNSDLYVGRNINIGNLDSEISGNSSVLNTVFNMDGGRLFVDSTIELGDYGFSTLSEGSSVENNIDFTMKDVSFADIGRMVIANGRPDSDVEYFVSTNANVLIDNVDTLTVTDEFEILNIRSESPRTQTAQANVLIKDSVVNVLEYFIVSDTRSEPLNSELIQIADVTLENSTLKILEELILSELSGNEISADSLASSTLRMKNSFACANILEIANRDSDLSDDDGNIQGRLELHRSNLTLDPIFNDDGGDGGMFLTEDSELYFLIEGNQRISKATVGEPSSYSTIDLINPIYDGGDDPVQIAGLLEVEFNHPTVKIGDTFDIMKIYNDDFFEGSFDDFEFTGLPENLSAIYYETRDSNDFEVIRVEVIGGDLLFVGNDNDEWDVAENWNLNLVPSLGYATFINNGNTAVFENDEGIPGAVRSLNIGTNGNTGTLLFQGMGNDPEIFVENDVNIGFSEEGPGTSVGSLIVDTSDFNFSGNFQTNGFNYFRVGVSENEGAAEGSIIQLPDSVYTILTSGFSDAEFGVTRGSGNATANVSLPDLDLGEVGQLTIGDSEDGRAQGNVVIDEATIGFGIRVGISGGMGNANGSANISNLRGSASRFIIGAAYDSGDSTGYLDLDNQDLIITQALVGYGTQDGNTNGTFITSDEVKGVGVPINITNNMSIGVSDGGTGTKTGSIIINDTTFPNEPNLPSLRGFSRLRVGRSSGTGIANGTLITPRGFDIDEVLVGGLSSGPGRGIGRIEATKGLSKADTLTLGSGSTIVSGINGTIRGGFGDGAYHAIDVTSAELDGFLELQLSTPLQGHEIFDIIISGSSDGITGDFDNVSINTLNSGLSFTAGVVEDNGVEVYRVEITGVAQNPTWVNNLTGASAGDWLDPTNWSTNRVPDFGDEATIDNGGLALLNVPNTKIIPDFIETFNLDVGINGGDGSLAVTNGNIQVIHSLNVGINDRSADSLDQTQASLFTKDTQIFHDGNSESISSNDPDGLIRGINFGYSNDGSVESSIELQNTNISFGNVEADTAVLRVSSAISDGGDDAEVITNFKMMPAEVDEKSFVVSSLINGFSFDLGNASAMANLMQPLSRATSIFDASFDNALIDLEQDMNVGEVFADNNASATTSGTLNLDNSFVFVRTFNFGNSEAIDGASAVQTLNANISDSEIEGSFSLARNSDSEGLGSNINSTINADIENTTFRDGRFEIFGGPDARDGGSLNAEFDVTIRDSMFENISGWNVIDSETSGQGNNMVFDGTLAVYNSSIDSTSSVGIPHELESEGGLASATLNVVFDNSPITSEFNVDLAGEIEAQQSAGADVFADLDFDFRNGSNISALNFTIMGRSDEVEVRENGIVTVDVDFSFSDGDITTENQMVIGEIDTDDNGVANTNVLANFENAFLNITNDFIIGIMDDDSSAISNTLTTVNTKNTLIRGARLEMSKVVQGNDPANARLNLNQSFILVDEMLLSEDATLAFDLNGSSRVSISDFITKKQLNLTNLYSAVDVTTTATLGGTLEVNDLITLTNDECQRIEFLLIDADVLLGSFDQVILPSEDWSLEINRPNGDVIAVFETNQSVLVEYTADANGSIDPPLLQAIDCGNSSNEVTAIPNQGFVFDQWSDGSTENPRSDNNLISSLAVEAQFIAQPVTATLSRVPNNPTNGIFTFTALFSEEVTGLEIADFTVQPSGLIDMIEQSTTNPTEYTITAIPGNPGNIMITLQAASVMSSTTSASNEQSNTLTVTFDGDRPMVTLSTVAEEPVSDTFTVVAFFDEFIVGASINMFDVMNGTLSGFNQVSVNEFEVDVTPSTAGPVKVQINQDAIQDLATNGNAASNALVIQTLFETSDLFIVQ